MSENVYIAIINGAFLIIGGFIGHLSAIRNARNSTSKQIYAEQLTCLWEPLEKMFLFEAHTDLHEMRRKIAALIRDNYKLVPKDYLAEFSKLSRRKVLSANDFEKLRIISASYYNWTKRNLGYPYEPKKILLEYNPDSRRKILATVIAYGIYLLLMAFACIILCLHIGRLYYSAPYQVPGWLVTVCSYIALISLAWSIFSKPHSKQF